MDAAIDSTRSAGMHPGGRRQSAAVASRSAAVPRGGGVCAALGAPILSLGPEPPYKPPTSPVSARACRRTGARGRLGSRELHLIGAVSAASGSGASSSSGRRRPRRHPRQLDADPNADASADSDAGPWSGPRLFLRSSHLTAIAAPAAIPILDSMPFSYETASPFLRASSARQNRSTMAGRFCRDTGCPFNTFPRISSCSACDSDCQSVLSTA